MLAEFAYATMSLACNHVDHEFSCLRPFESMVHVITVLIKKSTFTWIPEKYATHPWLKTTHLGEAKVGSLFPPLAQNYPSWRSQGG